MSGGKSEEVTVGYKYYLGMHMVLCHGPIDRIQTILVDDRVAWAGFTEGGQLNIQRESLFGGEGREGGISGKVDIDMGGPDQGVNSYLKARLGDKTPAFRGVVSAVLRRVYLGMNPYLKNWSFKGQRVYTLSGGVDQWYPSKAPIGEVSSAALYFALDVSGSMEGTRLSSMKSAIEGVLTNFTGIGDSSPVDIHVTAFNDSSTTIQRLSVSGQDVQDIIDWINNLSAEGGTDYSEGVNESQDFFSSTGDKPRFLFFISDGEPSPVESADEAETIINGISDLDAFAFSIELEDTTELEKVDNTPNDDVPIVTGGNPEPLQQAILNVLYAQINLNPAHIIRECLTDTVWGMGYNQNDVDNDTFTEAADKLYSEAMGISLLWDRQNSLEDFIQLILRHIDGTLRVNRTTGKFELKLVRDDYNVADLTVLDPSNIESVTEFGRPSFSELTNSVTVVYWDWKTAKDDAISVQDIALVSAQGTVIDTTVQYPGFTNRVLATRIAERDLKSLSTPLLTVALVANSSAKNLNVGDVFAFTWPDYGVDTLPMRVTKIGFGNGRSNKISVEAIEDIFATPDSSQIGDDEEEWEDPNQPPQQVEHQITTEATYYELLLRYGQTALNAELNEVPELSLMLTTATRPSDTEINAQLWTDSGAGYQQNGTVDFCPYGELSENIGRFETSVIIENGIDLDLVEPGSRAYIEDEIVIVETIDDETGEATLLRGALDTVPRAHDSGTSLFFVQGFFSTDEVEYVDSDVVGVKIAPITGQGVFDYLSANEQTLELNARAIRPFRPANLRAFGEIDPGEDVFPDYPVEITWSTRNRLQETTNAYLSWTDGNVTPESGVEYRVFVEALQEDGTVDGVVEDVTQTSTTYSLSVETIDTLAGSPFMRVTVSSKRDGFFSWQSPSVTFRGPFRSPESLEGEYFDMRAPANVTATLTGA